MLPQWIPALAPYRPLLVWLTKDLVRVRASFRRRGEIHEHLDDLAAMAAANYEAWPWGRLKIDADQIAAAARLFDPERTS